MGLTRTASSSALPVKPAKVLPTAASEYELLEEIGQGVSAKVWRARCKPLDEIVAIKILDLERQDPGKLARGCQRAGAPAGADPARRRRFGRRRRP